MYPQNPWELVADSKGSAKQHLGTTGVFEKLLFFWIYRRIVIGPVKEHE
jgi:hypothetical protein